MFLAQKLTKLPRPYVPVPSLRAYWAPEHVQYPHSEEEHFVATICGFVDEYHDLRVKTC